MKTFLYSFLLLTIFFFSGNFSPSMAAVIANSDIDTYVLTLKGNELNNVSGLNITIETKNNKADISPGVTFSSQGATALLSSVTSPSFGQHLISLALNGKIKDGQAIITGKFVANSIIPGAEFNVLKIERDGGVDLTNSITVGIEFKNSKTPTATPTPIDEESPTPAPATPTPPPLSQEGQDVVNVFFGDDGDVDPNILNPAIEEAIANSEDALQLIGDTVFKLKSNGLSKYYVRLKGTLNAKVYDRIVCQLKTVTYEGDTPMLDGSNLVISPEYFSLANEEFNLRFPTRSAKYRFDKRIKIPFLPIDIGLDLLKKKINSIDMRLKLFCLSYNSNDPDIVQFMENEDLSSNELTVFDILTYPTDNRNIKVYTDIVDLDIFAPEAVNTHK